MMGARNILAGVKSLGNRLYCGISKTIKPGAAKCLLSLRSALLAPIHLLYKPS
jgi:hypothetical protein